MANDRPIIIKKVKKIVGGGHHGGAWKVAYADFVTAMMAFFLLMWLVNAASQETLNGVSEYFAPNVGVGGKEGIGVDGGRNDQVDGQAQSDKGLQSQVSGEPAGGSVVESNIDTEIDIKEEQNFTSVQELLKETFNSDTSLSEYSDNLQIDMTPEGLRIQIADDKERSMFKKDSLEIQPYMKQIVEEVAKIIKHLPNYIAISGHSKSLKEGDEELIDPWRLTAMRANAIREFLLSNKSLSATQISRIAGKADTEPLDTDDPYSEKNIRISILLLKNSIVNYSQKSAPDIIFKGH